MLELCNDSVQTPWQKATNLRLPHISEQKNRAREMEQIVLLLLGNGPEELHECASYQFIESDKGKVGLEIPVY